MKRQRIEIMAQILALCIRKRLKTHIMYGTNLSYAQLNRYLAFLTSRDLLVHNSDRYVTTEKGHRFLEAFAWLNDVLEDRARASLLQILNESYEEVEIVRIERTAKSENARTQNPFKKAAIVVLIRLAHEVEKKTSEELKTELHKALEECIARIPGVIVEKVTVVEEN